MFGDQRGLRGLSRVLVVGVVWTLLVGVVAVLPGEPLGAQEDPADSERPGWVDELEDRIANPGEAPSHTEHGEQEWADPIAQRERIEPREFAFPEANGWEVSLRGEGERASIAAGTAGPVEVAAGIDAVAGERLAVEVFDRSVAERVGASGFVFEVSDGAGTSGGVLSEQSAGGEGLPAKLAVDYSDFEYAYGGGYAARLQVVALPDCVLEDPVPAGCETAGQQLPTRVDREAKELVVEVEDLAGLATEDVKGLEAEDLPEELDGLAESSAGEGDVSSEGDAPAEGEADSGTEPAGEESSDTTVLEASEGEAADDPEDPDGEAESVNEESDGGTTSEDTEQVAGFAGPAVQGVGGSGVVFGVMSGPTGEEGSWAASPLTLSGSWSVTPGSGEFSWSYPFELPGSPYGETPEVGMAYSSGAVDGLTNATNPQASQTGLGWAEFGNAYIERQYEPCLAAAVVTVPTPDLCWQNHNGTISLEGVSGRMLPLDANYEEWAVRSDAGWKVERLTGANNGANDGEYWKVTATDGTEYYFGLGENTVGTPTESAWTAPVIADGSGEPCRGPGDTVGGCDQAWRWNLDRIVDPDGNVTTFRYRAYENEYCTFGCGSLGGGPPVVDEYIRGGRLQSIAYGRQDGDSTPAVRVEFGGKYRCDTWNFPGCEGSTTPPTPSNGSRFPDVPNDLVCRPQDTCTVTSPSFFSHARYSSVRTDVWHDGAWRPVSRYVLAHGFSENSDGERKLALNGIQRVGLWQGGEANYPPVSFLYTEYPNRVDVDPSTERLPMGHHRLSIVSNEYGGLLTVAYGQNRPCAATYTPPSWDQNDRDCFPQETMDDGALRTGLFNKYLTTEVTEHPSDFGSPDPGAPPVTTTYEYGFDQDDDGNEDPGDDLYPAWAFNQGIFAQDNGARGWSIWRGYGTTTITQGDSESRVRVFRGMDGDPLWLDCGTGPRVCGERDVQVTPFSGSGQPFDGAEPVDDLPALAGRTLEEQQIGTVDGTPDEVVQSTLYEYAHRETHVGDPGIGVISPRSGRGCLRRRRAWRHLRVCSASGVVRRRIRVLRVMGCRRGRQPASRRAG